MKITVDVPDDVITRAIQGARVHYWGTVSRSWIGAVWVVTEREPTPTDAGTDGNAYRITSASLAAGLVLMAEGRKTARHFADLIAGTGDSVTGDVLIQCAAFGELRYG